MKKRKIALTLLIVYIIQFAFCGCIDRREVNDLVIVRGLAVDKADGLGNIKVSVQVSDFSQSKSSTSDTSSGSSSVTNNILTATSKNLIEAVEDLEDFSSKRIITSHNKIIILGKAFAEDGISPIMDTMERNHFFRNTVYLAVSNTTGYDVLKSSISSETKKITSVDELIKNISTKTIAYPTQWYSFLLYTKSDSGAVTVPIIKISENGLMIDNSAIFKDEKMVGVLSPRQTAILQWLLNNVKDELISIPYDNNSVSLYFKRGNSKIIPVKTDEGFKVKIKCTGTCEIRGSTSSTFQPNNAAMLKEIQSSAEIYLENEVKDLIAFAQHSADTDFTNLKNNIVNNLPPSNKNIDWNKEFSNIKYDVDFIVNLKEIGLIKNSIQ